MNRAQLATMLRAIEWAADDGAFNIGAGRYTAEQQQHLVAYLKDAAKALQDDLDACSTTAEAQRLDFETASGSREATDS